MSDTGGPVDKKDRAEPIPIELEMRQSYLDYAMSVIIGRALPDVRDGLKPVHRRVLYAMYVDKLSHDRPHRKAVTFIWFRSTTGITPSMGRA